MSNLEDALKQVEKFKQVKEKSHMTLVCENDQLRGQVEELQAWKDSAMVVEREWDAQAVAKMLGATPGRSARAEIARLVPELLKELKETKEDLKIAKAFHKVAVAERDYERHFHS